MLHGSHRKHGLNTIKGGKPRPPPTFFFSSLTEIELMKWICVYLSGMMWPFDRCIHCEIFITIQSSTHPSTLSFHVLYGDKLKIYSTGKFKVCSNTEEFTTVRVVHIAPQNLLILQLKVHTLTSPHLPQLPDPENHHPIGCYWLSL